MNDEHPLDRLPTDRAIEAIPGIGSDEGEGVDDLESDTETDSPLGEELTEKESAGEGPSRREQARKLLLGVSVGGAGLAVLAALVRRLLGGVGEGETDVEEPEAAEPEEPEPPAPDAEAVAAVVGMSFQLLVRALVGEDESETSTA